MLWSTYKDAYLDRLSLHGGRHHEKGLEILGRFTRYADPVYLEDIKQQTYLGYVARRKKDLSRRDKTKAISVSTLNGDIRYLNTAFAYAQAPTNENPDYLGMVDDPDWRAPCLKLLREPKRRPHTLSVLVLDNVFEACHHAITPVISGFSAPEWWQTFFLVAYVTGVRCGALLALPRPSIEDLAAQILRVPADVDKSDEERAFHLTTLAVERIRRLPLNADGTLFAWPHCRRYFYTVLHKFQLAAGIPRGDHGLPHDMRRTKATRLIQGGAPLPLVQREMGHSSPAVTAKCYVGEIQQEQRAAVDALPVPTLKRTGQLCLAFQ